MNTRFCSVDGCLKRARARGLCDMHAWRRRTHGDVNYVREKTTRRTNEGYVVIRCPGHPCAQADGLVLEHRKVWYDANGEIPAGDWVDCCNIARDALEWNDGNEE